jgi:hypothetical protein
MVNRSKRYLGLALDLVALAAGLFSVGAISFSFASNLVFLDNVGVFLAIAAGLLLASVVGVIGETLRQSYARKRIEIHL